MKCSVIDSKRFCGLGAMVGWVNPRKRGSVAYRRPESGCVAGCYLYSNLPPPRPPMSHLHIVPVFPKGLTQLFVERCQRGTSVDEPVNTYMEHSSRYPTMCKQAGQPVYEKQRTHNQLHANADHHLLDQFNSDQPLINPLPVEWFTTCGMRRRRHVFMWTLSERAARRADAIKT